MEERVGHLVRNCEDLTAKAHIRIYDNRKTSLRVVVEQPRGSTIQVLTQGQTPDEDILVGNTERITERSAAKVEMTAKLPGSVGRVPCRGPSNGAKWALSLTG
jgi:hypothetical protein